MKKTIRLLAGSCLLLGTATFVMAQEADSTMSPPKVLIIQREFVKPGKTGEIHQKSESAFVNAFARAKWPTHYLGLNALSGKPRCLFFIGYDSFADWEKDNQATQKNAALAAAIDHAQLADGELLSDFDIGVYAYNEEYSLRANVDIPHMRYFAIRGFIVRPGHMKDWDELVKLVKTAYEKVPGARWATYEDIYGQPSGTYLVITPLKSASDIDQEFTQDKDFVAALGEDGLKKLGELEAAAVQSSQTNLFQFDPKISYVGDDWIKADPEFWKTEPAMPPAHKKPAEKPAGSQ